MNSVRMGDRAPPLLHRLLHRRGKIVPLVICAVTLCTIGLVVSHQNHLNDTHVVAQGERILFESAEEHHRGEVQEWKLAIRVLKELRANLDDMPHAPVASHPKDSVVVAAPIQNAAWKGAPPRQSRKSPSSTSADDVQGGRSTRAKSIFWGNHRSLHLKGSDDVALERSQQQSRMDAGRRGSVSTNTGASFPVEDLLQWGTIFVSIASFRDSQCEATLVDLFLKAASPSRIFVGLVEQSEAADSSHFHAWHDAPCIGPRLRALCTAASMESRSVPPESGDQRPRSETDGVEAFCPMSNIRSRRTLSREAKGPTFGRYVAATMYQGESFFMMIDAHNKFIPRWDTIIIREYLRTVHLRGIPSRLAHGPGHNSETGENATVLDVHKVILSHYPAPFSTDNHMKQDGRERYMRLMCSGHFLENGVFRLDADSIRTPEKPLWQPFTAAGFLFANASLLGEVPFDPHLDYLFDGEEMLFSARAFSHGWDSYLPTVNILYHYYGRPNSPKVWSVPGNLWWVHQQVSVMRVLLLMNQTEDLAKLVLKEGADRVRREVTKYGMGNARTVESFWVRAGVNPHNRQHLTAGGPNAFCRQLAHK